MPFDGTDRQPGPVYTERTRGDDVERTAIGAVITTYHGVFPEMRPTRSRKRAQPIGRDGTDDGELESVPFERSGSGGDDVLAKRAHRFEDLASFPFGDVELPQGRLEVARDGVEVGVR